MSQEEFNNLVWLYIKRCAAQMLVYLFSPSAIRYYEERYTLINKTKFLEEKNIAL